MDITLTMVAALSLLIAMALALVVLKLLRDERARFDARVAVLTARSLEPMLDPVQHHAFSSVTRSSPTPLRSSHRRTSSDALLDDFEIRPSGGAVAGVGTLFARADEPSPWGRRLGLIAAFSIVVIAIGAVSMWVRRAPAASTAPSGVQQAAVLEGAPLELLSLHHVQEPERLVITGVVQNPRNGAAISRVVATVFLFGPDGAFLTSSRAPIDFTTLGPGVESPFVVSVPVNGAVSRYRVGFRTDDGRVISHVDRRTPESLAQK
jgi:hypothetical protein